MIYLYYLDFNASFSLQFLWPMTILYISLPQDRYSKLMCWALLRECTINFKLKKSEQNKVKSLIKSMSFTFFETFFHSQSWAESVPLFPHHVHSADLKWASRLSSVINFLLEGTRIQGQIASSCSHSHSLFVTRVPPRCQTNAPCWWVGGTAPTKLERDWRVLLMEEISPKSQLVHVSHGQHFSLF